MNTPEACLRAYPTGFVPGLRNVHIVFYVRSQIESASAAPNIPPKSNRRYNPGFSLALYHDRNAVERIFRRLKDFRRIGTRYKQRADVFLAAICFAVTVSHWL